MLTLKRPSHAFPGTYESREVKNEPQRLEHQRWRLAEILDRGMVSREMADYLRRRLSEIDRRLSELGTPCPPHGRWPAPARDEEATGSRREAISHD